MSINFSQPTKLTRVLTRLHEDTGVRALVDWRALEHAGWNPDGEATLNADKLPLGEALDAMLEPMDLTYRVINESTIEITTPAALAANNEIAFYSLEGVAPTAEDAKTIIGQIQTSLGEKNLDHAGGTWMMRYDEPSNSLIAALPQPAHRKLTEALRGVGGGE